MSNNILPAFACITVIGFSAALLPRLAAPSDTYISDSLNPVVSTSYEDFYFTYQPSDIYITSENDSNNVFVYSTVFSDSSSLRFSLQTCTSNSDFFSFLYQDSRYGIARFAVSKNILIDNQRVLFRISCSDGERTIYSNPFAIFSSGYYPVKSDDKKSESDLKADIEESEVFEENERSVENDVSDLGTIPTIDNIKENDSNIETDLQEEKTE